MTKEGAAHAERTADVERWEESLEEIVRAMSRWAGPWAVTGSAGLRLQGMAFQPGDLDLFVDGEKEFEEEAFLAFLEEQGLGSFRGRERPESLLCHRSYHGHHGGMDVEIMVWPAGGKSSLPSPWPRVRQLSWRGESCPVCDAAWERLAYEKTHRLERARAIAAALDEG